MREKKFRLIHNIDWTTVLVYVLLVVFGWLTITSATNDMDVVNLFDPGGRSGAQLVWMGVTFVIGFALFLMDIRFLKAVSWPFYLLMLIVLALTIFVAPDIKGSHSWLVIGAFRMQPAEFAKISTAMAMAAWMSRYEFNIKNAKDFFVSLLIFLIPMGLIILQSETGSALVFAALILVLFREGLSSVVLFLMAYIAVLVILSLRFANIYWGPTDAHQVVCYTYILFVSSVLILRYLPVGKSLIRSLSIFWGLLFLLGTFIVLWSELNLAYLAIGGLIVLSFALIVFSFWKHFKAGFLIFSLIILSVGSYSSVDYFFYQVLQPHQQVRIRTALGLDDDPQGAGYNVNQSKIAIGSGGLTGKGFHKGTQTKLKYVPEQETDFIFSTIGEEQGFIGTTIVLLLFFFLVARLLALAERQTNVYALVYGYSVASFFIFHVVVNIGMVLGLTPVIGIPLPFFSYGGSSMLSFSLLIFMMLKLDAERK